MGRDPRHLPKSVYGRTLTELTTRTVQGRYLLRPGGRLTEVTVGILARAQKRTGAEVHAFVSLSNHLQLLASFVDADQMAEFEWYVNDNLARAVNRIHDWSGAVWARRYRPIPVSDEEEVQVARLKYILSQGCVKEGLIASPLDWPGATSTVHLYDGPMTMTGIWIDRHALRRARQRGERVNDSDSASTETLELTAIPAWAHLNPREYRNQIRDLVHEIEKETSAQNRSLGRLPLGAERLGTVDPHTRHEGLERTPAPRFHVKAKAVRRAMTEAFSAFLLLYRRAADELKAGVLDAEFPHGCFPPRRPFVHPKLVPQ